MICELEVRHFRFYTWLPPSLPAFPKPRTFVLLPRSVTSSSQFGSHFLQAPNNLASDEIQAHTGMFDGKTNDGYYELGLITSQLIRDVIVSIRTHAAEDEALKPTTSSPAYTASSQATEEEIEQKPEEKATTAPEVSPRGRPRVSRKVEATS